MSLCLPSFISETAKAMVFSKRGGAGGKRPDVGRKGIGSKGRMSEEEWREYNRLKQAGYRGQLTPPAPMVQKEKR